MPPQSAPDYVILQPQIKQEVESFSVGFSPIPANHWDPNPSHTFFFPTWSYSSSYYNQLLPLSTLLSLLASSPLPFRPTCGLILLDFLIRHGLLTPHNEGSYLEIIRRSHRDLGMAMPEGS